MKTFFAASLFTLLSNFIIGQTNVYHPFHNGAQWSVLNQYHNQFIQDFGDSTKEVLKFVSLSDTLIEGKEYLRIDYAGFPGAQYIHFRDDSIAKRVYVRIADTDTLLYDFSVIEGQNISNTYAFINYPDAYVESIDSIQIGDNYRKRFNIRYTNQFYNYDFGDYEDSLVATYIIEGIGSQYGPTLAFLLNNGYTLNNKYELICYFENGEQLYSLFSEFANCDSTYIDYTNDIIEQNLVNIEVNIYPNPANTFLTISSQLITPQMIEIYDLTGKIICVKVSGDNKNITLDISNFSSGTYLIKLITANKILISKFIKL